MAGLIGVRKHAAEACSQSSSTHNLWGPSPVFTAAARDGVRRMILEGAPEAEIAAYVESFEEQLDEEAEAIYEEDESGERSAG